MKIACFTNSYGRFGVEAALRLLPQTGVRWLELPIKNFGVPSFLKETPLLTDGSTEAEIAAARRLVDESGLRVGTCNISSGNPLQDDAFERTLRKLDIAARFGPTHVVAGGGEISEAGEWPRLTEHLRRIGDAAAERGIIYCCETHPGTCRNADAMLELLERVDHPCIRINFDTGNIGFYNRDVDVLEQLRRVLDGVEHVHLKDSRGLFEDWYFPALGQGGAVDFKAVCELLESRGFDGPCSLEIEGIAGEAEPTLEEYQRRIVDSVAHLRGCGFEIE